MSYKYEPLESHLRRLAPRVREITVSFEELQTILDATLPDSAYEYREWWSNQTDTSNRPQARAWMSAGFRIDAVHQVRTGGWVRFQRTA